MSTFNRMIERTAMRYRCEVVSNGRRHTMYQDAPDENLAAYQASKSVRSDLIQIEAARDSLDIDGPYRAYSFRAGRNWVEVRVRQ